MLSEFTTMICLEVMLIYCGVLAKGPSSRTLNILLGAIGDKARADSFYGSVKKAKGCILLRGYSEHGYVLLHRG